MKRFLYWSCVVIFFIGTIIFALPDLYRLKVHRENEQVMDCFKQSYRIADQEKEGVHQPKIPSEKLHEKMKEYNELIFANGQADLKDPWSFQQEVINLDSYGVTDGVIGIVSIPKMNVELPIYLGAKEEHMAQGAVLLSQTSFPIDGENSNSVIAAHRGWKGSPMFRDIEALNIGDELTIRNPWEVLCYRVKDIKVIMPDEIEKVLIRKGKNMVTLVTCHPYTSNSRRYVVFCEKESVKNGEEQGEVYEGQHLSENPSIAAVDVQKQAKREDGEVISKEIFWRKVGYITIFLFGLLILISGITKRKKETLKIER